MRRFQKQRKLSTTSCFLMFVRQFNSDRRWSQLNHDILLRAEFIWINLPMNRCSPNFLPKLSTIDSVWDCACTDFLRLKFNSNIYKLIKVVCMRILSKVTCRIVFGFFPQLCAVIESIVASEILFSCGRTLIINKSRELDRRTLSPASAHQANADTNILNKR